MDQRCLLKSIDNETDVLLGVVVDDDDFVALFRICLLCQGQQANFQRLIVIEYRNDDGDSWSLTGTNTHDVS